MWVKFQVKLGISPAKILNRRCLINLEVWLRREKRWIRSRRNPETLFKMIWTQKILQMYWKSNITERARKSSCNHWKPAHSNLRLWLRTQRRESQGRVSIKHWGKTLRTFRRNRTWIQTKRSCFLLLLNIRAKKNSKVSMTLRREQLKVANSSRVFRL